MVIWITGLSASGKTTLSKAFEKKYKSKLSNMVLVDGDVIRDLFGNDLGFTERDRQIQIGRMQAIASFLEKQSILVIVAALYANKELLEKNRQLFDEYYEVYLKADIDLLQTREYKELYKNALAQKVKNIVGVDITWYEPVTPHLVFEVAKGMLPEEMAEIIYNNIYKNS
jgi:adenylylsulfate kinase-like enzyme